MIKNKNSTINRCNIKEKNINIDLRRGDCFKVMKTIEDDSVDLWITSPPYAKQRKYNGADSKSYLEFITPIMLEAKRT